MIKRKDGTTVELGSVFRHNNVPYYGEEIAGPVLLGVSMDEHKRHRRFFASRLGFTVVKEITKSNSARTRNYLKLRSYWEDD